MRTQRIVIFFFLVVGLWSCDYRPDPNLHLFPIYQEGKFGFMDQEGKVKIKPQYDFVKEFSDGYAAFRQGDKWGIIRQDGKVMLEPTYADISNVSGGYASFSHDINGKMGFIDMKGKIILPPKYDFAKPYSDGLTCVKIDEMWQYIDMSGQAAFKEFFIYTEPFKDGIALVQHINEKMSFIDKNGKPIFDKKFANAFGFSDGLALVSDDQDFSTFYFVDKTGQKKVDNVKNGKYSFAAPFSDQRSSVAQIVGQDSLLLGIVDQNGKVIMKPSILSVGLLNYLKYSEELSYFERNGKWGYLDLNGEVAISPLFDLAGNFKDGLALVQKNNQNYYINKSGVKVGPVWKYTSDSELINQER